MSSAVTPHIFNDSKQPPNSQLSNETTVTLSEDSATYSKIFAEKEGQTTDVYLSNNEFDELLKKASCNPDFQKDLLKIKVLVSNLTQPWFPYV